MRRSSSLVLVVVAAAVLGGAVSLLGAKAIGLTGSGTSTLVRADGCAGARRRPNEPVSASARPLLGNGFDPARIYAARSSGVVTLFSFFNTASPHAAQGSGFVVSKAGTS